MSKLIVMQEKRGVLASQMRSLLDNVDAEKGMTAEQETQWKEMDKDISALDQSIKAFEAQAELEARLDEYSPASREQPGGDHVNQSPFASAGYIENFVNYVRGGLNPSIQNALTVGTDADGGFTVPESWEAMLIELLTDAVVMRDMATVISTDSDRNLPLVADNGAAGWLDEEASYPESDIAFGSGILRAFKLGRIIKVSEELLSDSMINLESEIARIFGLTFGTAEEAAFITGNGTGKPTGVTVTATNGVTAAGAAAITYDETINLIHSVREVYRRSGQFLMKDGTVSLMRKLKSTDGIPLWQPSLQAGVPDNFLGYRVRTSEAMPAATTGLKSVAFGDFSQYRIADRGGIVMQRLNELYAGTGHVGFRMRKRVDGKLLVAEAVKTLTQA